jgi:hypothetical protein
LEEGSGSIRRHLEHEYHRRLAHQGPWPGLVDEGEV